MSQSPAALPPSLLAALRTLDRRIHKKSHICQLRCLQAAEELSVDIDEVCCGLASWGGDVLRICIKNQLLSLATVFLERSCNQRQGFSKKTFASLIRIYDESGRFDYADESITSLSNSERERFQPSIDKRLARHQLSDIHERKDLCRNGDHDSIKVPAYVVNLSEDLYRRARFIARAQDLGINCAVQHGLTPDDVTQHPTFKRSLAMGGSFARRIGDEQRASKQLRWSGNLLAQYSIWQRIIDQDSDWAYIFEDDSWINMRIRDFPVGCGPLHFVYINDRIVESCDWSTFSSKNIESIPIGDRRIGFPCDNKTITAPGADGYLLCREAASRLVSIIDEYGLPCGGTDWFLIKATIDALSLAPSSLRERLLRIQRHVNKPPSFPLNTGVVSVALSHHQPYFLWGSTRVYL